MTTAAATSTGTTTSKALSGSTSSRTAPTTPPAADAQANSLTWRRRPRSSSRYPTAPASEPGTSPSVLDTLATSGE